MIHKILMCPPTYFSIPSPDPNLGHYNDHSIKGYEIYKADPQAFLKKAVQQWNNLKNILTQKLGVKIYLLDPDPMLFDQVYTADASVSLVVSNQDFSLISYFMHPKRQAEANKHYDFLVKEFPKRKIIILKSEFEGSGDNVYDSFRDVYWSGYNLDLRHPAEGRSNKDNHALLSESLNITVNSLQVKRPYFHIDTCLAPLSRGHMIIFEEGLHPDSYKMVLEKGFKQFDLDPLEYLIYANEDEAYQYACNIINIDNKVILPKCGSRIPRQLQKVGYDVFEVDVSQFIYAGGGPHCLINYINQPRCISASIRKNHE